MQEIKCPNCGQVFQVDESGYAQIVQQIRDREFAQELDRREQELKKRTESDLMVVRMEEQKTHMEELSKMDIALSEKDRLIEQLKSQLSNGETEKKLAVTEAIQAAAKENDSELGKKNEELAGKDREIERLKAQLTNAETEKKLAVSEAVQEKDKALSEKATEITELKGQLSNKEAEGQLKEKPLKEQYEEKLKAKDEQIEYYKDFKARQSTKMVGESLEQHYQNQVNSVRMGMLPKAYVETTDQVFTLMGIYQSEWAHYDDIVWRHAFTHFGFILAFMLFPFVTTWVKQSGLASLPCFLYVFPCVGFVLAVILFFVMRSYSKRMRCSGDAYRKLIKMLPKDYQEKMLHDDIENTNRPTITIVVGVVMCVLLIAVALLIAFYLIPQWSTIAATAANKV